MKKKELVDKYASYALILFLLLQPVLDVLSYYKWDLINNSIRGIFLVICIIYLFYRNRKYSIYLVITMIIFLIYNFFILGNNLWDTVSSTMKFIYLPSTLLFFDNYSNNKYINKNICYYILLLYISIFTFSYIFKFGSNTYNPVDSLKVGYKGVFNSINEISAIIIALLPISTSYLIKIKNYIGIIMIYVLSLLIGFIMGTKVLTFGVIIILLYYLLKPSYKFFKRSKIYVKFPIILGLILVISSSIYLFTFTNTYINMITQANYFNVKNIFSYDYINKVIFNDRLSFLELNIHELGNSTIINRMLGVGFNTTYKLVEIDIFDIFIRYGIIGFILFFIPIINTYIKTKIKKEYLLSTILLILISLTSGHVLVYPAVCIYFGLILFLNKREYKGE